jgi:signal transduction histidine kinase
MKNCLLAIWLALMTFTAHAAVLTSESTGVNLLHSAQFMEDPSGDLRLDNVRGLSQKFQPWTGGGSEMNFGFTSSAYWIRVPLQRDENAPKDWLLALSHDKFYELDFYPPQGPAILTGSGRPLRTRPYFDRSFVFPLEVATQQEFAYLRVTSKYALTVPLKIWQPSVYQQDQLLFYILQFLYFGGLIILAIYGLIIFSALRDVRFLIYCAYIVTAGFGMFVGNGFGRLLIWPDSPAFDEVTQCAFLGLAAFFAVMFAAKLLLADDDQTWLRRGMQLSELLFLLVIASALLHLVVPHALRPANQLLMINAVAMSFLVGVACFRAYKQRREGIRFFIAGWLILWLGIAVGGLRSFGWVPTNGLTFYAVQISTALETILMAMALADLLRIEHEAYAKTQVQALEANRALLEITQTSEMALKRAVLNRTEQLEASLKLEKNLRAQYARFVSMISHEFRTPLSIIQIQVGLMRKENERGIDQIKRRLDTVGSATQRLAVMFDKWLHSDAINQTLEALQPKHMDIKSWLQEVVRLSAHLLVNHYADLQLQRDASTVFADEYHLGVAVTNLIDNAAKYSPSGTTITIKTLVKEGYIGLEVANEGPGIPLEMQDKIFNEFFRLSPENSIRGVGLGLSIVQRIAKAHGGHVTLASTPGRGAAFTIWLPTVQRERS